MPFNSHCLFPVSPDYTASPAQVLRFFELLMGNGILSPEPAIRLRLPSADEIYVRDARTGERIATGLKRMNDAPAATLAQAEEHLGGVDQYVLKAQSSCQAAVSPFDLREKDGSAVDPSRSCVLSVSCILRDRRTQLSEPWHEHLRTFLLPQEKRARACPRCGAIHEPEEEVQPRFWIEFFLGGVCFPSFSDASKIFDPTLLSATEHAFQTRLFHGRLFN